MFDDGTFSGRVSIQAEGIELTENTPSRRQLQGFGMLHRLL